MMRRLFAASVFVALLGPWISGSAVNVPPIVPCPMHHARTPDAHAMHNVSASEGDARSQHSKSDHGTTARGCNCAGECGRSGAAFSLIAPELRAGVSVFRAFNALFFDESDLRSVAYALPPATGPPQRLRT